MDQMARRGALFLLTSFFAVGGTHGEQIIQLDSRPGVKQPYLLVDEPGKTYQAAVIYFPGYGQELELATNGLALFEARGNFLAKSWGNSDAKIVVAIADPPSDLGDRFTTDFRRDERHATDVSSIVRDLKRRFPGIKIFLAGISTGTISAAYAGSRLGDQLAGVILMSSMLSLRKFDLSSIHAPVLFVHSMNDECVVTPYENAKQLASGFTLISVNSSGSPGSEPCGTDSAHTFFGKRGQTATAIANWMFGRRFPREVR